MKQMRNLVFNECLKILRQTGFKILFIIFAVIVALLPLLQYGINYASDYSFTWEDYTYGENYVTYETEGNFGFAARMHAALDVADYFQSLDIPYESGEYLLYGESFLNYLIDRYSLFYYTDDSISISSQTQERKLVQFLFELYQEMYGIPKELVPEEEWDQYTLNEDGTRFTDAWIDVEETHFSTYLTDEVLQEMRAYAEQKIEEVKENIRNFTFKIYYTVTIHSAQEAMEVYRKEIAEYEKQLAELPEGEQRQAVSENLTYNRAYLEAADYELRALELLEEKEAPLDSWEYATYDMIQSAKYSYAGNSTVMTQEEYSLSGHRYMSYAEYFATATSQKQESLLALQEGLRSLEENIPLPASGGATTVSNLRTEITTASSVSIILLIVMAGTLFASEYSTGTVRLLLIRPRKRWKIFTSKLITLLLFRVLMTVVSLVLLFVVNGLVFGFDGYSVSRCFYVFQGTLHTVPVAWMLLIIIVQNFITTLPMLLLAVMLSVIIHRSALATALPMILKGSFLVLQTVCASLLHTGKLRFLAYTPLPYLDLAMFHGDVTTQYFWNTFIDFTNLENINDMLFSRLPWLGIGYLLAFSALFLVLSFIIFNRQDVKN